MENRRQASWRKIWAVPWLGAITLTLATAACHFAPSPPTRPAQGKSSSQTSIDRAIEFLLSQQGDDGLWHSPNYGNMRGGAAMTAFVVYALHPFSTENAELKKQLQRGVDALIPQIRDKGYVTNPDGPDYTNYGSALLLSATSGDELTLPASIRDQLVEYLVEAQLNEEEGFQPDDPNFGGWDLSGWMTGSRPTTGTTISVTSYVAHALQPYRQDPTVSNALDRLRAWIERLQNFPGDGGLFFHPRRSHDGNKAGWFDDQQRNRPRSYGSATADGLRIQSVFSGDETERRIRAAIDWLQNHPELKTVPGFEHETGEGSWAVGLRYYYYQAQSYSLDRFPKEEARRRATEICRILHSEQRSDGSWSNPNARMREDDPLIATGLAVIALRHCAPLLEDGDRP